jgi:dihydroorotate dehydrogenase electron transfer subunit
MTREASLWLAQWPAGEIGDKRSGGHGNSPPGIAPPLGEPTVLVSWRPPPAMTHHHRNTIFLEDAWVLEHQAYPSQQHVLRLEAPRCAAAATPGTFVHVQCAPHVPMRRPLSIMRANPEAGWIEVLYKVVGAGLQALSTVKPGGRISLLGPIGRGFAPDSSRPRAVLIGGGVGIPPLVFLAERLAADRENGGWQPVAFLGSEAPFPFRTSRATVPLHGLDHRVDACMPALEAAGVPSRLASLQGYDGCYNGYVTALAAEWLAAMHAGERKEAMVFACGPEPMLRAAARVAADFDLPCQLCVEEFMACGVGGCAGCAIRVQTPEGPAMKRVCVDGPVFDAKSIYAL